LPRSTISTWQRRILAAATRNCHPGAPRTNTGQVWYIVIRTAKEGELAQHNKFVLERHHGKGPLVGLVIEKGHDDKVSHDDRNSF
jgi:hypothetical protein